MTKQSLIGWTPIGELTIPDSPLSRFCHEISHHFRDEDGEVVNSEEGQIDSCGHGPREFEVPDNLPKMAMFRFWDASSYRIRQKPLSNLGYPGGRSRFFSHRGKPRFIPYPDFEIKPEPERESVEEYLARGGTITHCKPARKRKHER